MSSQCRQAIAMWMAWVKNLHSGVSGCLFDPFWQFKPILLGKKQRLMKIKLQVVFSGSSHAAETVALSKLTLSDSLLCKGKTLQHRVAENEAKGEDTMSVRLGTLHYPYLRSSQLVAGCNCSSRCLNILPAGSLFKQVISSRSVSWPDIMTCKSLPVYLTVAAGTTTNELVHFKMFHKEVWSISR